MFYKIMDKNCIVMILPPEPLADKLTKLARDLELRYNIHKPRKLRSHITVKSLGDISRDAYVNTLLKTIDLSEKFSPFTLYIEGKRFYGSIESIPGVYLSVKKTPQLVNLHKTIVDVLGKYSDGKDRSFKEGDNWNPHVTVVRPDISAKNLERAKIDLHDEEFSYSFPVEEITLYSHIEGYPPHYFHIGLGPSRS
jgi:2'-5' RNA ligase